jgi:hypothetical protein
MKRTSRSRRSSAGAPEQVSITESDEREGEYDLRTEDGDYAVVMIGSTQKLARVARDWEYNETAAWLSRVSARAAWLEAIEVEEKGRGRGTLLMDAIVVFLKARRVKFIFAHAHADPGQREALARWYTRQRFTLLGVLDHMPVYLREID